MSKGKGAKYGKAWTAAIARPNDAPAPVRKKISREQWVINLVTRIVGTKAGGGFVQADDVASDIILLLLNEGGFSWEEDEIERFCHKKAAYMVRRYTGRKEQSECEFSTADGEEFSIFSIIGTSKAMQEICFEANEAYQLLQALPRLQRRALEILCGGGNPINVAEELGVTPWNAVRIIKEGRDYLRRVDPLEEAA